MTSMQRMLIDGLIAVSIALAFLFQWHGKDHEVLMIAMSLFASTSAIDYGAQSPNARLFITRLLAISIGTFAMTTGHEPAKLAFWIACGATFALSWARLHAFVKQRRENN